MRIPAGRLFIPVHILMLLCYYASTFSSKCCCIINDTCTNQARGPPADIHIRRQLALLKCYVLHPKHDLGIISVHKPSPLDIGYKSRY
ncbi:hypothetical protein K443DRAFT_507718 [Laccaria amethystina LaAM-08-1]|uniref:Secreted protein n=1 Tax=Laccaria amethystina LaAM-08-1 TaxID=1095629 RepID=A0A0C9XMQ9_9AGAR|nr:hypothetical protein K443DRAFT_507718 [Laccaria amethystina LaAM-08-1]